MRKSAVFFSVCVAFIAGVAIHSFVAPDRFIANPFSLYVACASSIGLGVLILAAHAHTARKFIVYVPLFSGFLLLGMFRYAAMLPATGPHTISNFIGREITVSGFVRALPRVQDKTVAYILQIDRVRQAHGDFEKSEGRILVSGPHDPQYRYGDALIVSCKPTALSQYEQYARKEGVSASCAFVDAMSVSAHGKGVRVQAFLFTLREKIATRIISLFPNPYAGLLAGILYGDTSGISSNLRDAFRRTGIAHITALSGYNITVLSNVLVWALIGLWCTRTQALPATIVIIGLFTLATGADASVVRAAVMGTLVAAAQGFGRLANMKTVLAFAGAAMLWNNPYLLRLDLGFQLSFLSTIGLVLFSSEFASRTVLKHLPRFLGIREAGASSAAALLITMPLLLHVTGMISPLALLVNILVVPTVPFAMLFGAIALAFDFAWHPLGIVGAWVARVLLQYIIAVAEYFGKMEVVHLPLGGAAATILFLLVFSALWIWKTHPQKDKPIIRLGPPSRYAILRERVAVQLRAIKKVYQRKVPPSFRVPVKWTAITLTLCAIVAVQLFAPRQQSGLRVYFFDIGQGDGYLIRTQDGFDVLVDGGPTDAIVEKLGRTLPFDDRDIELMILTHPHADHVTGLNAVLKRFEVKKVLATGVLHTTNEYRMWLEEIKRQGIPFEIARAGQVWPLENGSGGAVSHLQICPAPTPVVRLPAPADPLAARFTALRNQSQTVAPRLLALVRGARLPNAEVRCGVQANDVDPHSRIPSLTILYPIESFAGKRVKEGKIGEGGGLNDTSVVAKLVYGHASFLLMGDATKQTEDKLIPAYGDALKSDVLKVGHHGSKYSSSAEFLSAVKPTYGVIQVGAKNKYGHPTFAALWRLSQAGVEVLRNDKDGDVVMESDGKVVRRVK